jgi:thioredoxin 1
MRNVEDTNFTDLVLNSPLPVLVDFWAFWCVPCRGLTPVLEQLETEYSGLASIVKMDVDSCPLISQEYAIRSVPTMVLFVGGNAVECLIGVQSKSKISLILDKYIERSRYG